MSHPLIYLIAGEPSGDLLGQRLMAALKALRPDLAFAGIGGEGMREEGLVSLFPQADLAVMGLAEVVPSIPLILRRLRETLADIEARQPAVVVTIDSWGFTGRVAHRLKEAGSTIPRVHYVAPMVWAWKAKRAHQLAERVDRLLCLLPNEPAYFEPLGLKAIHVGHAVLESGAGRGDGAAFRRDRGIAPETPLLCVLPGSRRSETSRLLPVFEQTVRRLAESRPSLEIVMPTVETVAATVEAAVAAWPQRVHLVRGTPARYDAFAASCAALAASGTVALELAMAGLPMAIAYKVNPLTAMLARRMLKIRYVSLINLLMDREVVPEFLQERCRPDLLAGAVEALMDEGPARREQRQGLKDAIARLGGASPSLAAAREILVLVK